MTSSQPRSKLRIFIDSSVFFAAAFSASGPANALMVEGASQRCILLVSGLVLEETRRNLLSSAGQAAVTAFDLLTRLTELQAVPRPSKMQVVRVAKVVNLKDAPIVAAAAQSKADFLVTHDRELLRQSVDIESHFHVPVVSPGDILHLLREG